MEIKPIKTEADYEATIEEIERLLNAELGSAEADRLDLLTTLVEAYEEKHYAIPLPDLDDAILYFMERQGIEEP
jgi:HTH-type transcriptional regulator / antitoxin HigA